MNKRALVAVVAFLALVGVYFVSERAIDTGVHEAPAWSIPALKADADRIEIVREGDRITLEKKDGAWRLAGDNPFPAAKSVVDGVLDTFEKEVGVDLKVPVTAEELARYELDDKKGIPVTFSKGGQTLAAFVVGKAVGKRTFVKPLDETVVYRAKESIRYKVDKGRADWREKKIFEAERDDVTAIVLHHPASAGGPITLERDREDKDGKVEWKESWRITTPVAEVADKSTVSSLIGSVINVRAADFADDVPVAEAGFGPDSFKVEVRTKEGKGGPHILVFGGEVGEARLEGKYKEDVFAMKEGAPTVYVVRKYTMTGAVKDLEELRNKDLFADLKREAITALKIEHSGTTLSFTRTAAAAGDAGGGDHWQATAPAELVGEGKLDESPLNSLLSSLSGLRAARVLTTVDEAAAGFGAAERTARVSMTLGDKGDVVLVVGRLADEEKKEWYARTEGTAGPIWILRDYVVRQMTKGADGYRKKDAA